MKYIFIIHLFVAILQKKQSITLKLFTISLSVDFTFKTFLNLKFQAINFIVKTKFLLLIVSFKGSKRIIFLLIKNLLVLKQKLNARISEFYTKKALKPNWLKGFFLIKK